MDELAASEKMKAYFQSLEKEVYRLYEVAKKARKRGLDPLTEPEIHLATDVASKVEGLMGLKGIGRHINSLSKNMDRENVAFKIAQEIAKGTYGGKNKEERADKAIRSALAILTEGVTAAPLEGIAKVKIKRNEDNSDYLAIYFAGPIRSAGGTEAALTVIITDYVRQALGLAEYKATRQEALRMVEEIDLYNRVMNLQIPTTHEQIEFAVENLPVEVTGESTNKEEVSAFRDIPRIETNSLRGGACLVLNDGIIGRAMKIMKTIRTVGLPGWEWLPKLKRKTVVNDSSKKEEKEIRKETQPNKGYIKDVIAGRPIFAHPSKRGGFRIRYGHSRNTGLAGIGIHPATMKIVKEFLAPGTHIRTERPGKGSVVMPVDTIEGPTVKLRNGSVIRLETYSQATKYASQVREILFLGDLLVGFGEFYENNHRLIPSGYVEEWWALHLESCLRTNCQNNLEVASQKTGLSPERILEFLEHPLTKKPNQKEALAITKQLAIPLHPYFTYPWHDITIEEYFQLREDILAHQLADPYDLKKFLTRDSGLVLSPQFQSKRLLERLGIPHIVKKEHVIINGHELVLEECLQLSNSSLSLTDWEELTIMEFFDKALPFKVKDKIPIYSGARMGRPEKAKERKMRPPIHSLFPIEMAGAGNRRLILEAAKKKRVQVEVVQRECPKCHTITFHTKCPKCHVLTKIIKSCPGCGFETDEDFCPDCRRPTQPYSKRYIDLKDLIVDIKKRLGGNLPPGTKGVKKLMNRYRIPEILEKGFLRARHKLNVYKDGTTRFDSTDIPLMHFKPRETLATIPKLRELGYSVDINGVELDDENQIVELKVQDIVLNINNGKYLVKVANYIDDLLDEVYNLPRYYNIKRITDLIGHLVIGLAPHTSSGITGRIIGFTSVKGNLAHPYWHAAKRRNCDGDEDAVILMLDGFLNFSKEYLPITRGGSMDAPLTVGIVLNPMEVDDEAHAIDCLRRYPLEFFEKSFKFHDAKSISRIIDQINNRLETEQQYENFHYTHETSDIAVGPKSTAYSRLGKMQDKLDAQLNVAKIIRAVDVEDVAERVLNKHFFPDMIGCLRAFGSQTFRCIKCNTKYRRLPLTGKCIKCADGGKLLLTVHRKTITKYFETAKELAREYALSTYIKQRLVLFEEAIEESFIIEEDNQTALTAFIGKKKKGQRDSNLKN
jgi:DNA polymerase II large subunit